MDLRASATPFPTSRVLLQHGVEVAVLLEERRAARACRQPGASGRRQPSPLVGPHPKKGHWQVTAVALDRVAGPPHVKSWVQDPGPGQLCPSPD